MPRKEEIEAGKIRVIQYSEKAIAVIGDTRPIKDKLKELMSQRSPIRKAVVPVDIYESGQVHKTTKPQVYGQSTNAGNVYYAY